MSSLDNEAASNNKTETESVVPSSKTFHYVSLPIVLLERIDEQLQSDLNSGQSYIVKKSLKKLTKPVSQKLERRNSPRKNNCLPEKRRIKLTNKSEEILHIIDFRCNSPRKFIMEDQEYHKVNNGVTKQVQNMAKQSQNVTKPSKAIQQPLLVVRSKTEINRLADKKLNSTPVVPIMKQKNVKQVDSENFQNKQLGLTSHSYSVKQSTSAVQVNKGVQNKQTKVIGHPYGIGHNRYFKKGNSVVQINKSFQNKQTKAASHLHKMEQNVNSGRIEVSKDVQNKQREVVSPHGMKHNANTGKQKANIVQVVKNIQNKQRDLSNLCSEKHNTAVAENDVQNKQRGKISVYNKKQNASSTGKQNDTTVQVDKILQQNKQINVASHTHGLNHTDKAVSPAQNKISVSKEILRDQTVSSSTVQVQKPGPAKRKLPEAPCQHNKVQKLGTSIDVVNTENSLENNTLNFVNNTKVPPDRKTAKVVPLAKARKSITLPKSDVNIINEAKNSKQKSDKSAENLEAVKLLSKLVGMPISADKMEIVLRKENGGKEISTNKNTYGPSPPKKTQGVSNLSKLLSDSLRPSTSEAKITSSTSLTTATVSSSTPVTEPSSTSVSSTTTSAVSVSTTTTSTASNISVTTPKPVSRNSNTSTTSNCIMHPKTSTSVSSPKKFSDAQPVTVENSFGKENSEQSFSLYESFRSQDNRTIYDVMADISLIFPSWNLHILEDTNTFCIACIRRNSAGMPAIAKCIELDEQFNAKVYVHQNHCKQFDGQYDDESSIVALVNTVHLWND